MRLRQCGLHHQLQQGRRVDLHEVLAVSRDTARLGQPVEFNRYLECGRSPRGNDPGGTLLRGQRQLGGHPQDLGGAGDPGPRPAARNAAAPEGERPGLVSQPRGEGVAGCVHEG